VKVTLNLQHLPRLIYWAPAELLHLSGSEGYMREIGGKLGSWEHETLGELMWAEVDYLRTQKDSGLNIERLFIEELINIVPCVLN
jgi:hypothetical protein